MTEFEPNRRTVLLSSGAALTIGLAGCIGGDGGDGDGDDGDGDGDGGSPLEDHLADANNWDEGDGIADHTGQDEVEVENGVGSPPSFEPPAIEVDQGTTVRWVWVSDNHSVTANDNEFDSGIQEEGYEFEHTFDESGDYLYHCQPHRGQGQLGGVRVQ